MRSGVAASECRRPLSPRITFGERDERGTVGTSYTGTERRTDLAISSCQRGVAQHCCPSDFSLLSSLSPSDCATTLWPSPPMSGNVLSVCLFLSSSTKNPSQNSANITNNLKASQNPSNTVHIPSTSLNSSNPSNSVQNSSKQFKTIQPFSTPSEPCRSLGWTSTTASG